MDTSDLNADINIIDRLRMKINSLTIELNVLTLSYKEQKFTKMWSNDPEWVAWY